MALSQNLNLQHHPHAYPSNSMHTTFNLHHSPHGFQSKSKFSRRSTSIRCKIREIFMPALSSTMTEGKIVSWIKSEGDKLSKGESVVVVESDKADMDVETFYDGYLAAIVVEEGGIAPVGSAIALLSETEAGIPEAKSRASKLSNTQNSNDETQMGSSAVTDPTTTAPMSAPTSAPTVQSSSVHPASEGGKRIVATPYAKKLAKDLNVELAAVTGSGPQGRIVAKDVEAAAGSSTGLEPLPAKICAPPASQAGNVVPFTAMQNAVSRNMVESLAIPTFRVGYSVETNALDELYKKIKSKGVTMTSLLAKATALALIDHPVVNSSCRDGKSFTYNNNVNIAIAVAMDGGLITPVLPDADKADIYSLSRKWKELAEKARKKQLQPHEYTTGTFTLSNLGMFGVDRFDAILPPGTGAIMAVGASEPTVVATRDGRIGIRSQMQVSPGDMVHHIRSYVNFDRHLQTDNAETHADLYRQLVHKIELQSSRKRSLQSLYVFSTVLWNLLLRLEEKKNLRKM